MRRLLPLVGVLMIALAGCSSSGSGGDSGGGGAQGTLDKTPVVTITSPADGSFDISTAAEVEFSALGADSTTVSLASSTGTPITGRLRTDGSAWVPDHQLAYGETYTLVVNGVNSDGAAEARSTFTTMLEPTTETVRVQSNVGDGVTYGVGMPIILSFARPVPEDQRDDIQRRLFVTTNPPQEGSWHWIERVEGVVDEGAEVHYRPKDFWQPGTTVTVRAATGGVDWGDGTVGRNDLTIDFAIGDDLRIEVSNSDKQLRAISNGQVINQAPVSLGRPSAGHYSSAGTMVIFEKHESELFDSSTYGLAVNSPDGYRTTVQWVMKLTEGGEYIHAAPWSVWAQGNTNTSHGCVNVSTDEAIWLYQHTLVGTPVTVTGTEKHVVWRDGVTDWDRSWEDYITRSALDYTPALTLA